MVGWLRGEPAARPIRDLDALQGEMSSAMHGRLVVVRLAGYPLILAVDGGSVWLDPDPWRIGLGAVMAAYVTALFGVEYWRWRWGWSGPRAFEANVVGMLWAQLCAVLLTGGLDSPVLPVLPMAALQVSLMFGIGPPLFGVLGAQLLVIWTLVALGLSGTWLALAPLGPAGHGPVWTLTMGAGMTVMLLGGIAFGTKVRRMVASTVDRTIAAHESERAAHADHARELVALSAEIAHELKNPLASIKGLSSLLARDLDGKAAERLSVLRAEVDRMQETLEEFLNFSRPLVPLTQTEVDLRELVQEVATLCEGMARSRGVSLVAEGGPDRIRADRRKLRQVLVNLVQNAIDVAPPSTAVELVARRGALEVLDRGPGLTEEVRAIAFEPGVTTRARGSGLGLTIARALVQQHSGALRLLPREGGGTRAVVTLGGVS